MISFLASVDYSPGLYSCCSSHFQPSWRMLRKYDSFCIPLLPRHLCDWNPRSASVWAISSLRSNFCIYCNCIDRVRRGPDPVPCTKFFLYIRIRINLGIILWDYYGFWFFFPDWVSDWRMCSLVCRDFGLQSGSRHQAWPGNSVKVLYSAHLCLEHVLLGTGSIILFWMWSIVLLLILASRFNP